MGVEGCPESLGRGAGGGAGGPGLGDMEMPGWGGCCYQLSFQQDAFEGGEEGLVHSEALEPCSCPLFRGPVPAVQSTEHLHGPTRHSPSPPAAQGGKQEDGDLADGEADKRKKALEKPESEARGPAVGS